MMRRINPFEKKSIIYYDNGCYSCVHFSKILFKIAPRGLFQFIPLRQHFFSKESLVNIDKAYRELALETPDGKCFYGFDAMYYIISKIIILWPLVPLFFLLKVLKIGNYSYNFFARRRKIRESSSCIFNKKKIYND